MSRPSNDNQYLSLILDHFRAQGRTLNEFLTYAGIKKSTFLNFYLPSTVSKNPQRYLPNPVAYILVKEFGVLLEDIRPVVEPGFAQLLAKGESKLKHFNFLHHIEKVEDAERYKEVLLEFLGLARRRIYASEYVPGYEAMLSPSQAYIDSYAEVHRAIFAFIEELMEKFPGLEYRRVWQLPPDTALEAKFYAMSHSRQESFEHMYRLGRRFPKRVHLYAVPGVREMSYALVDSSYIITEQFRTSREHEHKAIYQEFLSVEEIRKDDQLSRKLDYFEAEFETISKEGKLYKVDLSNLPKRIMEASEFFRRKLEENKAHRENKARLQHYEECMKMLSPKQAFF